MPTCVGGVILSKKSYKVLSLRFLLKGSDGRPVEAPEEMLWRVSYHVARGQSQWGQMPERVTAAFRFRQGRRRTCRLLPIHLVSEAAP
jgi:ribonucleotide reductase alpha subunit